MEKKLGLIVSTDGTTRRVHFDNDNTYEVMSGAVGGWVEAVRLSDSLTMWVNEEGKFMGLDVNKIGTIWFENAFGEYSDDVIVGDVFFTGGVDARGYTKGISVNQASSIEYAASAVRSGRESAYSRPLLTSQRISHLECHSAFLGIRIGYLSPHSDTLPPVSQRGGK